MAYCTTLSNISFGRFFTSKSDSKGEGVFAGCRSLISVEGFEHYSAKELGEKFFYSCPSLKKITLNEKLKDIGISAFEGCLHLDSISGGFTLSTVGLSAFKDCRDLLLIDCKWDTSEGSFIDEAAFYNCWNFNLGLEPVKVPVVGKQSFYCCRSLMAIDIPNELVPDEAFYGCNQLSMIYFSHENAYTTGLKIGSYAFYDCNNLKVFSGWIADADEHAFDNCWVLGSAVWVSNGGDISATSFSNTKELERLTIINKSGSKNHKIESGAFSGSYNLKDVFHVGVTEFPTIQSGAFPTNIEEHVTLYVSYKQDSEYKQDLKDKKNSWSRFTYQEEAYYDWQSPNIAIFCRNNKYRHLLNGSLVSGEYQIPEKVDGYYVTAIDYQAFKDNQRLTSLKIPVQIQDIDAQILNNCSKLEKIYVYWATPYVFANNLPEEEQPFLGVDFEKVTLYVPKGCKKLYEQAPEWKRFKNIKEGGYAGETWTAPTGRHHHRHYKGNGDSTNESNPYVVCNDGTLTFYCDNQRDSRQGTKYELNEGNKTPGWSENANNITAVLFDASFANARPTLTSQWFSGCKNLTGILGLEYLNTSEVTDMTMMFYGCSSLTSLDVSNFNTNNVTEMNNMLSECRKLSKLTLGNSFTTTEELNCDGVFANCYNLNTVSFTGDIPSSINSKFFAGVGTANNPVTLDVPTEYRNNYAAKFSGNMFYGGYFTLSGSSNQEKGDLNGDSEVNGTDLVSLIGYIIKPSSIGAGDIAKLDLNGDGEVNGTDLVALVNIIMNNGSAKARSVMARSIDISHTNISIEPLNIGAGESREITITLSNPYMDVTMVQLDMVLPKGLSIKGSEGGYEYALTDRTTWNRHSLYIGNTGNTTRLLMASGTNALIDGTEGGIIRLTLTADDSFEGGDIEFKNMLCTSPDLQESHPQSFTAHITGNATGIQGIDDPGDVQTVYNLSGQRLKTPRKGMNIVNGKKMVVK